MIEQKGHLELNRLTLIDFLTALKMDICNIFNRIVVSGLIGFVIFCSPSVSFSQTPGAIQDASSLTDGDVSTVNPLDPNEDGWISTDGAAFSDPTRPETPMEINYLPIPQVGTEPDSDFSGGGCGTADVVDNPQYRSRCILCLI